MNFLDAVSFHANALALSLGESIGDVAVGTKKFLVDDGKEFSWKLYSKFRDSTGISEPVSKGLVGLFGYVTHIIGGTMIGAGEAIGNGAGMIAVGIKGNIRNPGETIALGATGVVGGLGAGLAMGVAPTMPRPQIAMQTFNVGMDGAIAVATSSVQVSGVAVPSVAAASITGALAMRGTQTSGSARYSDFNLEADDQISDIRADLENMDVQVQRTESYDETVALKERLESAERKLLQIRETSNMNKRQGKPALARDASIELSQSLKKARRLTVEIDALERHGGSAKAVARSEELRWMDEVND